MTPEEVEKALYGHIQTPAAVAPAVVAPAVDDDHIKEIEKSLYGNTGVPAFTKEDYQVKPDYTLQKMGAGVAAGMLGRAGINRVNPDMLYNPDIEKQAAALPDVRENVARSQDVHYEQQMLHDEAVAEHQRKIDELKAQQRMAEMEHKDRLAKAAMAAQEHAYVNTLTPEDILREQGVKPSAPQAAPTTPATPTAAPIGGSGTAAYAEKFGATPEEAKRIPSMSVMQQQNIPQQAAAWDRINSVAPGFQQYAESPLLLGEEGKKALAERMQTQQQNETLENLKKIVMDDEEKKAHGEATKALSKRKAESKLKVEAAHASAKESHENAQEIKRLINRLETKGHGSKPPSSVDVHHQENMLQELEDRVRKQFGNTRAEQVLSYVGRKVLPRFTPYAGAALAPLEAEKAAEEWKRGNKMKAAAYGLGALGGVAQSTGIPIAMGAGDVMQIPSIAIGLNDALGGTPAP